MLYRDPNGTIAPLPKSWSTSDGEILGFNKVENPEDYGFWPWSEEPPAAYDPATHKAVPRETEDAVVRTATRVWDIVSLSEAEIEANRPPVPETISDCQFAQQLAIIGTISEEEAIAWASRGDLPLVLTSAIDSLPAEDGQQFAARMLLSSATVYERSHPMTGALGGLLGYDGAELDEMWRAAAVL